MTPFEPADAAFNARPPIPALSEPTLPLVRQSCRRFPPWSRQDDPFDTTLLGSPFICRRRQFTVPGDQCRWAPELLSVLVQAWDELRGIIRIALQDARLGDDTAFTLSQPEHATELG